MATEMIRMAGLKYIRGESRQDAEMKAYRLGMWLAAGILGNERAQSWCKSNGIKAQAEDVVVLGGALVPQEFNQTIIELRERYGAFRRNTKVVPMASETQSIARRTTGATIYWVDEGGTPTESTEAWDAVSLNSKKIGALTICTNEVYDDAIINLGDEFAFEVAWGFSQREDECGFIGDGTSTYRGMVGAVNKLKNLSPTIANIAGLAVATGTGYATNYNSMVLADLNAAAALLPAYADTPNTGWFMHRTFFYRIAQLLEVAAGGTAQHEPASGDRPSRPLLLGYPVNFAQVMPKASAVNQVCALFGDLSRSSKLGDRREIKVRINPYTYVSTDQLQLVAFQRFDINNHDFGNADATAANRVPGPVVGLITGAS